MSVLISTAAGAIATNRQNLPELIFTNSHEQNTLGWFGWPTTPSAWDNGNATRAQSSEQAHTGTFSAKCTLNTTAGDAGIRLAHDGDGLPGTSMPDAYYSAWYYFPSTVQYLEFGFGVNVFQWKRTRTGGSDPIYNFVVTNRTNGGPMYLRMYRHIGNDGGFHTTGEGFVSFTEPDIPVGQWFHIEALYVWRTGATGQVRAWFNGSELFNLTGVPTEYGAAEYTAITENPRQWSVNYYVSGSGGGPLSNPATTSIYIDDAAIADGRVWGVWP